MTDAAIITGSAGAIGKALVAAFREMGYFVVGVDRADSPEADAALRLDLAELAAPAGDAPTQAILAALGERPLKVLINNAAIQQLGSVETLSVAEFRRTLDVNVTAAYALVQACLERLSSAGGSVVNIGSIHARQTKPAFAAYATSKGALETMTRALAVELGSRVRVNAISMAAIDTPMLRAGFEDQSQAYDALAACHPTGRIGTPAEVARLALFLAGGEVPFQNGAVVDLTGGIAGRLHDPV
ncbi:SDR family oxidoreductase [Aquisalimonas lutea]|uniref:SDR family NAD(P)-dependent oxidoreductase n=1 Tax=Aquisalimonas lutea TaxID=1327750 RepID=UPI0025B54B88|nr:SDR family oxidoreductase [Aquisalimonas lutea]MDN3517820.1 SDR family oxidoreductase [Aquisalimonas lutea]